MVSMALPLLTALACSLLVCAVLIPLARATGLVDHPATRKVHAEPTPLVGGVGIFLSMLITAFLFHGAASAMPWFITAASLMLVTGVLDDRFEIRVATRALMQLTACLMMIYGVGWQLYDFGRLVWTDVLGLGWLAVPITLFSAMGVINAYNMIDGMDGLAGSLFLVTAAGILVLASDGTGGILTSYVLIGIGAVAGFMLLNARLPWNRRARVFLGDSGSLMLGFVLAWWLIRAGGGPGRIFAPITAVYLIAIPLLDTSTLIYKRAKEGKSPFEADQYHLHHAFLRAGFSIGQAWCGVTAFAVVMALIGIVGEWRSWPEFQRFYTFIFIAFGYFFYMRRTWQDQRFLGRDFIYQEFAAEAGD
jgi:UDP-GlcNAc:undecaprenyl-phosphate GlcNAc-1-phosphate transferase